tara:strand:- start:17377 stop:18021 length:645 start_codon:yes stop_codon:yes gene_type:complete
MKNILILNSSIIVKKPIFKNDLIRLEYGESRINSYAKGLKALKQFNIYNNFEGVYLTDNTMNNLTSLPDKIRNLLPENTIFVLKKNNKLGRKNKGAGMIASLATNISVIEKSKNIFYFEPRLIMTSDKIVKEFLSNNNNMFSYEGKYRVKTGYFGSKSLDLATFLRKYSAKYILDNNIHIEDLMYEFYSQRDTLFQNTHISKWKNYITNIYEPY